MADEIDTSAEAVERLADYLNTPGQGLFLYDAAATLRALVVERDAERQRAEQAEAEVRRLSNPPEEYCAKCGAPKSNHPYRHPFQPKAALRQDEGGE